MLGKGVYKPRKTRENEKYKHTLTRGAPRDKPSKAYINGSKSSTAPAVTQSVSQD